MKPWGDVAAPLNRTKGPIVARNHYPLKTLHRRGLHHGNEISKMGSNSIGSFVLSEPSVLQHRSSDLTVIINEQPLQSVQGMTCACKGHFGVNNAPPLTEMEEECKSFFEVK